MPNILGLWRSMLYKYSKTTETTNWQSSLSLQSITPSTKCQPSNTAIKLCQVWLLRRLYPPKMESGNFDCKGAANVSCRWAGGSVRLAWHVNTRNHKKRSHHHPRANIHFNWWFVILIKFWWQYLSKLELKIAIIEIYFGVPGLKILHYTNSSIVF